MCRSRLPTRFSGVTVRFHVTLFRFFIVAAPISLFKKDLHFVGSHRFTPLKV